MAGNIQKPAYVRRTIKSISMSLDLADGIEAAAARRNLSLSEYCREALDRAVRRDLRKLDGEPLAA